VSEHQIYEDGTEPTYEPGPPEAVEEPQTRDDSLSGRMKQRAEQLSAQKTEIFDVPGFEGIVAVEFRMLSYERSRKIGQANDKVRSVAMRELYNMADQLVIATERFYEVMPDGTRKPVNHDWVSLARGGLDRPLPAGLTPRQALLAVVGDRRVSFLYGEWEDWQRGERTEIDSEVVRDFEVTT
jgi:hypothetical protein